MRISRIPSLSWAVAFSPCTSTAGARCVRTPHSRIRGVDRSALIAALLLLVSRISTSLRCDVLRGAVHDTAFCRCKRLASRTGLSNQSSHGTASRSRAQTVRSCDNLATTLDRMLAGTDDDTSRSSIPDPGTRSRRSVAVEYTSGNVADVPRRELLVVE
jgi:hypothetical protein